MTRTIITTASGTRYSVEVPDALDGDRSKLVLDLLKQGLEQREREQDVADFERAFRSTVRISDRGGGGGEVGR